MAEAKTKPTGASVAAFLKAVEDDERRKDCRQVAAMMKRLTGRPARMWGTGLVGFGSYRGGTGDWPVVAFAPRKSQLTLYLMAGFERHREIMRRLGKHKSGQSCLHLKRLADVDRKALEELVALSVRHVKERHPD